jgi:hypothetical protein
MSKLPSSSLKRNTRTAEQAHAVDAASRPQDRGVFDGQNQFEHDPDVSVAAQLMGRPLGRLTQ